MSEDAAHRRSKAARLTAADGIVARLRDDGVMDTFGQNGIARQPGGSVAAMVFNGLFVDVLNRPTVVGTLF